MRLPRCVFGVATVAVCLCTVGPASAQTLAPLQSAASDVTPPATSQTIVPAGLSGSSSPNWLKTTIGDFRNLASKDNVAWLAIGGLAAGMSGAVDHRVTATFAGQPKLESAFHPGATVGDGRVQIAAAVATLAVGKITGTHKLSMVGGDLIRAQIVAAGVTAATKYAVQRTRPDGTNLSFPSGHTSTAFATATVLQRDLGWKFGIPAYAAAAYVGASRVEDKRHFLSDVAFGAAIGVVAGRTVTIGRGDKRFAMVPSVTDGGAAINFSWVGPR
jgi:membrane-associated phospholipid phosphatase